MSVWTQGLNPEQVRAVQHNFGPLLILAGAGSGKTTVLVSRTGRLISEKIVEPKHICVLTFTNKAARELKHRVSLKVGAPAKKIWAGTFHSFGLHLLRKYHKQAKLSKSFGIIDTSDCSAIIKELIKDVKIVGKDKYDTDKVLSRINDIRTGVQKQHGAQDEYDEMAEILTPRYIKKLDLLGVVDFEALLLKPLDLFKKFPEILEETQNNISQLMVDEFQDTNMIQMDLVTQLVKKHKNISVVGDDDQSIYGWRGACVSNILDFPQLYKNCEVIRLERNYRSTPEILEVANEVIKKNKKRHGKILRSEASLNKGEVPELFVLENEEDEAEFTTQQIQYFLQQGYEYKDMAILYRSNSQGGLVESFLRRSNLPYAVSGGSSFFDRKEIKDILAYLRAALTPHDVAYRRIINTPHRGIGDTTIEKLVDYADSNKLSFVEAVRAWKHAEIQDSTGVHIEEFLDLLKKLPDYILKRTGSSTAGGALIGFLTEIGYRKMVYASTTEPASAEKKWQLIEIFSRVLDSVLVRNGETLSGLRDFIDMMELRDDAMDSQEEKNEVQLMTLHACKGLEFPVCLMIGLEEDVLPHKTLGSDVDEERRLFYVGVTRAQKRLVLSRCQARKRHGVLRPSTPSRFLLEIPKELIIEFPQGVRPVSGIARESLVSSFLAKLDTKIQSNPNKGRI